MLGMDKHELTVSGHRRCVVGDGPDLRGVRRQEWNVTIILGRSSTSECLPEEVEEEERTPCFQLWSQ